MKNFRYLIVKYRYYAMHMLFLKSEGGSEWWYSWQRLFPQVAMTQSRFYIRIIDHIGPVMVDKTNHLW
jgi:hypothetical protein